MSSLTSMHLMKYKGHAFIKAEKVSRRKHLTLIPAFACKGGFVIHADSEENCGAFRRSVQKIIPKDMGELQVIVAGAGIGSLIDGLIDRLKERLDRDAASDIQDVKRVMEQRLPHFYANEVANYPCSDEEKLHKFIVAAHSPGTKQFSVWASSHTRLIPVTSYELAGVEDKLYDYFAQRLYTAGMTFEQAILAGLYLLIVAEATSSYVRAPFHVAAISENGIEMGKQAHVKAITERLAAYEQQLNALFLASANTGIAVPDFEDLVDDFKRTASALHREQIDQQVARTSFEEVLKGSPLTPIPGMITFGPHGYEAVHDRQQLTQARQNFRKSREWVEAAAKGPKLAESNYLRPMQCTNDPCKRVFFAKFHREQGADPVVEGICPDCGKQYRIQHPDLT